MKLVRAVERNEKRKSFELESTTKVGKLLLKLQRSIEVGKFN